MFGLAGPSKRHNYGAQQQEWQQLVFHRLQIIPQLLRQVSGKSSVQMEELIEQKKQRHAHKYEYGHPHSGLAIDLWN